MLDDDDVSASTRARPLSRTLLHDASNDARTHAARDVTEIRPEAVRMCVRVAVELLGALGRAVARSAIESSETAARRSSEVSLSTMRVVADAFAEQIANAMRRAPGVTDRAAANEAWADSVSVEELAACLERHIAARLSSSRDVTLSGAERIRCFIEAHYAEQLTLDKIADAVGCARSSAAAMFKHEYEETMHRYIARMRMRRAAELVAQGDKVEAVMLSVGYRSKKNFYRQFRRETGLTPGAYRLALRGRALGGSPDLAQRQGPDRHPAPGSASFAALLAGEAPAAAAAEPQASRRIEQRGAACSVTVSRAGELFGVSRRTVYHWIEKGKLQTIRFQQGGRRILVDSLPTASVAADHPRPPRRP